MRRSPLELERQRTQPEPESLSAEHYTVIIDLDAHRLLFRRGSTTLWTAPVGTGTGLRLRSADNEWDFSTPTGTYHVQYKELDPIWIAPDWFFIENGLPTPPKDHPSRFFPRGLGAAAVYIHPDLAVHGTDRPELLGQPVSHGCIRLENRYALRLYHNVQVGTEVIIVGGEGESPVAGVIEPGSGSDDWLGGGPRTSPAQRARWEAMTTQELATVLADLLRDAGDGDPKRGRWDEAAVLLVERARSGDRVALAVLFEQADALPGARVEHEWATYLVGAFRRAPVPALEVLATLAPRLQRRVARMLVDASLTLYHDGLDSRTAPWPSRAIPDTAISAAAAPAWDVLLETERAVRQELAQSAASTRRR